MATAADKTRGNWNVFKGKLREKWGELTDDELDRAQGQREQLIGNIQRKVGQPRNDVESVVNEYADETGYRFM